MSTASGKLHVAAQRVGIGVGGPTWAGRGEVEWQVASWVHWYNSQRLRSSTGTRSSIALTSRVWVYASARSRTRRQVLICTVSLCSWFQASIMAARGDTGW